MDQEKKLRKHSWKEINKPIRGRSYRSTSYFFTHYALRGGASNHGTNCGAFYVAVSSATVNFAWHVGAVLS